MFFFVFSLPRLDWLYGNKIEKQRICKIEKQCFCIRNIFTEIFPKRNCYMENAKLHMWNLSYHIHCDLIWKAFSKYLIQSCIVHHRCTTTNCISLWFNLTFIDFQFISKPRSKTKNWNHRLFKGKVHIYIHIFYDLYFRKLHCEGDRKSHASHANEISSPMLLVLFSA